VKSTRAGAILVAEAVRGLPIASLVSSNPYLDFARALELFYQPPRPTPGISPLASLAPTAEIGEGASIGAFAVVASAVKIGRNTVLHPHAVIYEGATIGDDFYAHSHAVVREFCRIGNRVVLGNGVVVGGDGYGFAHRSDGSHYKIPQSGVTVIEDDVEIQSLTSVDRATIGESRVKRGAKIDSLSRSATPAWWGRTTSSAPRWAGGQHGAGPQRGADRAGRRLRPPHHPRQRGGLRPERHWGRREGRQRRFRLAGVRRPGVAARGDRLPELPDLVKTVRDLRKKVEHLESMNRGDSESHA